MLEFFVARNLVSAIRLNNVAELRLRSVIYNESVLHFARELLNRSDERRLSELLGNEDAWVRFAAAHFLSRLNAVNAVHLLRRQLASESDFVVRREIYIALAFLGDVAGFRRFIEELADDSEKDQINDGMIVEYFGGLSAAISGCSERLTSRRDYPVREMLIRFLGKVGSRSVIPVIRPYLDDTTRVVAETSKAAIDRVKSRSQRPQVVRALLLDLDGVVVDSIDQHAWAWRKACWAVLLHDLDVDGLVRRSEGQSSRDVARVLIAATGLQAEDDLIEALVRKKRSVMRETETLTVIPETRTLMRRAKEKGVSVALVTGSSRERAEAVAHAVGVGLVDAIVSEDDGVPGKPAPDPYLLALLKVGAAPDNALVLENAPLGVDSAQSAGIYVAALTTTLDVLTLSAADEVVESALDLIKYLK